MSKEDLTGLDYLSSHLTAQRVAMDQVLKSLFEHLSSIKEDPTKPLDDLLLQKVDQQLVENLAEELRTRMLVAAQELLPIIQQDASPLISLLMRLIQPDSITFEQVDNFLTQNCLLSQRGTSDDQYLQGLESPNKDINMLILNFLHKARKSPSGIGLVASKAKVVQAIITVFLTSTETAVAEKAAQVLEDFLLAGDTHDDATPEKNLMVRRIFRDRDIYESLFSLSSLKTVGADGQASKKQRTIAQARLLNLIVNIDHPSSPIRVSQFPDIEQRYDITDPKQGILYYVFVKMIDLKDDDLLLSTFIQLCTKYIGKKAPFSPPSSQETSSYAMTFLKENHIHAKCMSYFLSPTERDGSWLMTDSSSYLHVYCEWHEDDLLKDKDLCSHILQRLSQIFQIRSRTQWQVNSLLHLPLLVLGSLPRRLLLPTHLDDITDLPPLFDVPAYSNNPHVLMHLQRIFCESRDPYKSYLSRTTPGYRADRMMARVLYLKYLERNPNFWEKVVELADDESDPAPALTAIDFMSAFVEADWEAIDQSVAPYLPSEEAILSMREGVASPRSGLEGMLLEGGVTVAIAGYFFSPTKPRVRNRPDVQRPVANPKDSAASSVPMAKVQLTIRIRDLLEKEVTREGHSEMMDDLFDGFKAKVTSNARDMREKAAMQGGTDSVATMRR